MAGNKDDREKRVKELINDIETIYANYNAKINQLNSKQSEIINSEIKKIEQDKIERIRNTLTN